jgi:DNA-binding response OmpR family regulator
VPDIVLLDWMVESLSGIEVCRRLRKAINADGRYHDIIRTVRSAGYALDTDGVT